MNHKKVQRLWRQEGLRVPQPRRRKRVGASTAPDTSTADAPNKVWAVDFLQFDSTTDGRPVKIVSILDQHTPGMPPSGPQSKQPTAAASARRTASGSLLVDQP